MEWVEVTAKTVADAKDRALDKLQVDEADAEFEVLEEPRVGLFGRTKGEARVRARVRPAAPRAKLEPRERRRRGGKEKGDKPEKIAKAESVEKSESRGSTDKAPGERSERTSGGRSRSRGGESRRAGSARESEAAPRSTDPSVTADAERTSAPAAAASLEASQGGRRRPPRRVPGSAAAMPQESEPSDPVMTTEPGRIKAGQVDDLIDTAVDDVVVGDQDRGEDAGPGGQGPRRARRSRGGRGDRSGESNQTGADREDGSGGESEDQMGDGFGRGDHDPVGVDIAARRTATFMEGLVASFGYQAEVDWSEIDDETGEVSLEGESLGLLIGPKGKTLGAINEVARIAMLRAEPGAAGVRVHVDVSRYRQRRREALTRFAHQVAAEVEESGTARALEPMSAADRKLVHDAVNELAGVRTTSDGEEPYRRVVIHPAGGE